MSTTPAAVTPAHAINARARAAAIAREPDEVDGYYNLRTGLCFVRTESNRSGFDGMAEMKRIMLRRSEEDGRWMPASDLFESVPEETLDDMAKIVDRLAAIKQQERDLLAAAERHDGGIDTLMRLGYIARRAPAPRAARGDDGNPNEPITGGGIATPPATNTRETLTLDNPGGNKGGNKGGDVKGAKGAEDQANEI